MIKAGPGAKLQLTTLASDDNSQNIKKKISSSTALMGEEKNFINISLVMSQRVKNVSTAVGCVYLL